MRYSFLLSLMREHVWSYLGGGLALAATLWMSLSIPRILQAAIDILAHNPDPSGTEFLNRVGWILFFAVAVIFTRTASRLLFFTPGRKVEFDLKNRLLTHLTTLQRDYFIANPSGAIISRINNDINWVRMMVGFGLMNLANALATLTLAPYYMYQLSPRLTLYCAAPIAAVFVVLQLAVRSMRRDQQVQMHALQQLSDFTVESYSGIDVLKTYRGFGWAEERFGGFNRVLRDAGIRMSNMRAFFMPMLMHMINGLKVMLVLVGGTLVIQGGLTIGGFMAYALYLSMMVPPLMGMTFMMFVLQRGFTGLASLETIFRMQPDLPPVLPESEAALPEQLSAGLSVRGLTFAYSDEPSKPVLREINLQVRPGEVVGIFGAIGSGKTTLVNLCNRYLTPPPGSLFLDGVDVTEISQAALRRRVVTVTQEPFLFSDSVRANVLLAATDADEALLPQAVDASALASDLERLPDGVDTLVGEKGITLSGGQKQRISLARSILKPCDLLILDDVLSAVDHETERFLIEQIYRFEHARALLIVSHRISVLERAQRIVVLEDGRVADVGSHDELIARDGIYRQSWEHQSEQGLSGATELAGAGSAAHSTPEGRS